MLFANVARRIILAGAAGIVLLGAGCAAQQANTPVETASANSDQVLPPGTTLNVGQGTYIVPALPSPADETGLALTGRETSHQSDQIDGRWIQANEGWIYIPSTP